MDGRSEGSFSRDVSRNTRYPPTPQNPWLATLGRFEGVIDTLFNLLRLSRLRKSPKALLRASHILTNRRSYQAPIRSKCESLVRYRKGVRYRIV